jgi:hypothetical protein
MAAAADRVSHRSQYPQHRSDDDEDDPDGPQDRDFEHESGYEKDDSEDDHGGSLGFDVEADVPERLVSA